MSWLKRRLPKKRWKRVCIYVASVLLILVAADMILAACWRRIEIGPETTNITSPLNAAGFPDYIAAINDEYGRGVTLENNAMPLLLQITGTADLPEPFRLHSLSLIGLPSDPKPPLLFTYPHWYIHNIANTLTGPAIIPASVVPQNSNHSPQIAAATTINSGNHQSNYLLETEEDFRTQPWTRTDNPLVARYLASQQEVLHLALQAVDRSRYFLPIPADTANTTGAQPDLVNLVITGTLPRLSPVRNLANILAMDAMRCIGEGDPGGFQRDALAIMKLARLVAQGPTLIEQLIAIAIDDLASRTIKIAAIHANFFTTSQAQQLLHAMNSLAPLPSAVHVFNTLERWFALYRYCNMSRSHNAFVPIHYNAVLRSFNHFYDQLIACYQLPTYHQRKTGFETFESEIKKEQSSFLVAVTNPAPLFFDIMLPSLNKAAFLGERANTDHQLARTALALAAYKAQHGRYPDAIAQLVPEDLKEIPLDPFSNAPLIYRLTSTGYLLYSFGPNEKDDGGVERDSNHPEDWDIVVRAEK